MSPDTDGLYRHVLLPPVKALTRKDPEVAHEWMVASLGYLTKHPRLMRKVLRQGMVQDPRLHQTLMDGIEFQNPFGTAAGMDKKATVFPALGALTGVGHVEIGGVTLKPQAGKPRPRIHRVDKHHLINAMDFPNDGVDETANRLRKHLSGKLIVGVQIVLHSNTPEERAASDYAEMAQRVHVTDNDRHLPDYLTVNVSCPNTDGLRALQAPASLEPILDAVTKVLDTQGRSRRRLLVKLAPDMDEPNIAAIIDLVVKYDTGGVVLTNTTTARPVHSKYDERPGGFSGSALYERSSQLVKFAAGLVPPDRVLVAVGGIDTVERAYEMLQYADLIEGYTGLVLQGPGLFRSIAKGVIERMQADGVKDLPGLREGNRPSPSGNDKRDRSGGSTVQTA